MKLQAVILSTGMAALTAVCFAHPKNTDTPNADPAPVIGVWRCDMHSLPAVTLTVTNEGGSLNGAVLFYLHKMEKGQPETATPGVPEPLIHPSFDGKTFTFQVSHRRAHPPQSLNDGPVTLALKLSGSGKAELVNTSENDPNAPVYEFVKNDY